MPVLFQPRTLSPLSLAAIVLAFAAVLEIGGLGLLFSFEGRLLDGLVKIHAAGREPDPDIVIVDIDNASLGRMQKTVGRWPWPRSVHGELIEGLARQHPRAIVFDILFSEQDIDRPESDRDFNAALQGHDNVYFPMLRLPEENDAEADPIAKIAALLDIQRTARANPNARVAVLPPLAVDAKHWRTGIVNFDEDRDGVGRRYWLEMPAYGWRIPSLPARIARDLGYPIPDEDALTLNWRGAKGAFRHVSYADVFDEINRREKKRPPDEFKNAIVIVGSAASMLHDLRVTPIDSLYPGQEVLATAIDNLKNQRWMRPTPAYVQVGLALVLLAFVWEAFRLRRYPLEIGVALGVMSVLLVAGAYIALGAVRLVPVFTPLVFAWSLYLYGAVLAYIDERKQREHAVRLFSRFLNPALVSKIVDKGETVESLSGKTREITILFSDIRGFTTMSETRPAGEIVQLLNRYFSRQVEVVFQHGGTLDKFIGDCIMALWGAPLDDARHAEHAVAAALEMERVLEDFKTELGAAGANFDVGIGIHSGSAVVGFIGAEQKLDYTAIGDAVNLASRIEGLTKNAKSRILVSRDTAEACHNAFEFRSRGKYKVKGRAQEVELFEPRATAKAFSRP
jgi:adenylate cyclase